ncbi:hypothetical protein ABT237_22915 [Streptomyces sp. NPDC001581]|uniref:hypothetical protein n=1 Tax=Streptomyces sp. NPDC001581 TaxID=3154386 RepID=UPI0033348464
MSHDLHTSPVSRSKPWISRFLMVLTSAAFVSGTLALPASAAVTHQTRPSVTTDTPGGDQDHCPVAILCGGAGGDGGNGPDPNREPGGGAYGPNTCKPGYVWADSFDGDSRCVTPADRQAFHDRNPHRQPGGGAYGPSTCEPGYVWRERFDGDTECVTPGERWNR